MKFSLISPTFGRPEEVTEFLESLLLQDYPDFEVILGDGTPGDTLRPVLERFHKNERYPLTIIYEEYLPVSDARNRAAEVAHGEYIIFLDSDCLIPSDYLKKIEAHLQRKPLDAFGGPDAAHKDFTALQKAISFSMTSLLTTGGIRGKKRSVSTYHPRGFNMGMRKEVFEAVNGYSEFRCGEDIELSIRIIKAGYKVALIPQAYVYHKRRTTLKQFFKQVFRFGAARINIWKRHKEELKLTHFFPLAFMLFVVLSLLSALLFPKSIITSILLVLLAVYIIGLLLMAIAESKSLKVALLAVITSFTMLFGYGWGFFRNFWAYSVQGKENGMSL